MQNSPILFREESKPPRLLTWLVVFLAAGAVTWAGGRNPGQLAVYVYAGALCAVLFLELVSVFVEVTATEVLFCISPFYQRRIVIAEIQHCEVRTYPSPAKVTARLPWRPPKHCIELTMKDGSQFSITSVHPEGISHAISRAREMAMGHEIHSAGHNHAARA